MNIYLITEDGNSFCVKAETMVEAIKVCEEAYLNEEESDPNLEGNFGGGSTGGFGGYLNEEESDPNLEEEERSYYHRKILQSCAFVGELGN